MRQVFLISLRGKTLATQIRGNDGALKNFNDILWISICTGHLCDKVMPMCWLARYRVGLGQPQDFSVGPQCGVEWNTKENVSASLTKVP